MSDDEEDGKEDEEENAEKEREEKNESEQKEQNQQITEETSTPETTSETNEQKEELTIDENFAEDLFSLDEEQSRWMVKIASGANQGAEFFLEEGKVYTLGSDAFSADIVLHDGTVSKKHAEITVVDENTIHIKDLNSRNGVKIGGSAIEGEANAKPNTKLAFGNVSLFIFDRTKSLETFPEELIEGQEKEEKSDNSELQEKKAAEEKETEEESTPSEEEKETEAKESEPHSEDLLPSKTTWFSKLPINGTSIIITIFGLGLLAIIGTSIRSLFKTQPIPVEEVNYNVKIERILNDFPHVSSRFDRETGHLFLEGHVSTHLDSSRILHGLNTLPFITRMTNYIIIDEGATKEINQVLAHKGQWLGVEMQAPSPGAFILKGYLQTKQEVNQLDDYIKLNFDYPFENRVVATDEILNKVRKLLQEKRLFQVRPDYSNGELTLRGILTTAQIPMLNEVMERLRGMKNEGIVKVKSAVSPVAKKDQEATMIDISDRYRVTGATMHGNRVMNVVIQGRVLSRGSTLDGMVIIDLKPNVVVLEREGTKYKIRHASS